MQRERGARGAQRTRALLSLVVVLLMTVGLVAFHGTVAPAEAHDHASVSAVASVSPVVSDPVRDVDPLWPPCPAPVGHGDAGAGCGLVLPTLDVWGDAAVTPSVATCPSGALRCILATRELLERAPSLVELSIRRT